MTSDNKWKSHGFVPYLKVQLSQTHKTLCTHAIETRPFTPSAYSCRFRNGLCFLGFRFTDRKPKKKKMNCVSNRNRHWLTCAGRTKKRFTECAIQQALKMNKWVKVGEILKNSPHCMLL